MEILVPNTAMRNLIRENKIQQIYGQMQIGQEKFGMQTLNQSLLNLVQRRHISIEEALGRSAEGEELRLMMERAGLLQPAAPRQSLRQ
jgi:twitching motility protein PilT